jgi:parallel beta-helix repeat protein
MNRLNQYFLFLVLLVFSLTSCKEDEDDNPLQPQACIEIPEQIEAGTPVQFSSACSQNADSVIWTFGDGGTSTEEDPVYVFTSDGTFTVTLTVTNANGNANSTVQQVNVEAPEFYEHSGNITEDETWVEGTHIVTGDVYVRGATLTIMPGAEVQINLGRGIYVGYYNTSGSTLIAEGTETKPITFTSTANTKAPGDWDLIGFYEGNSNASSLKYCIIEYGGGNTSKGVVDLSKANVAIENTQIRRSGGLGISVGSESYFSSFTNNEISETASYAISIDGNYANTIGVGNDITTDLGIEVKAGRLEQSEIIWKNQTVPYVVTGDLYLGHSTGSTLTFEPGTEIQFVGGRGLYVGYYSNTSGTLIAEGTSVERIKFSSSNNNKSAGDWDFIGFYDGTSSNTSLKFCDFEYGGGNSGKGIIHIDDAEISIENCKISNSEFLGISSTTEARFASFSNNEISNTGSFAIQIYGNAVHTLGSNNNIDSNLGIEVSSDRIEISSGTWLNHGVPYVVTGDLYIGSATGTEIIIEAGTTVAFAADRGMYIGYYGSTFGKLVAQGNVGSQITFTSAAPEGSKAAGSWDYIGFYDGTSSGSILDYCIVEFGGKSRGNVYCSNTSAGTPTISNCTIRNSGEYGIYVGGDASPSLSGNTFSNNNSGDTNMNL